jgi:uncharacterized protein
MNDRHSEEGTEGVVAAGSLTLNSTPCVPGLFSEDGKAKILGSRCTSCGTPYFPRTTDCRNPDCTSPRIEDCSFGGKGKLWSYSTADFAPPPPHKFDVPFKPYLIGVVDLDDGLRLVGQMCGPLEGLTVGSQVELVIDDLYHEGVAARRTWKFKLA